MGNIVVNHSKPLRQLQWEFMPDISRLIVFGNLNGYRFRAGDFYRDERVHGKYGEKSGYSAAYSNHKLGIAGDLMLFTDEDADDNWEYEKSTTAYAELGDYWESLREENVWGGHWQDGNHFSKWYKGRW
jgi:hypothetical protein